MRMRGEEIVCHGGHVLATPVIATSRVHFNLCCNVQFVRRSPKLRREFYWQYVNSSMV